MDYNPIGINVKGLFAGFPAGEPACENGLAGALVKGPGQAS
jgi:hypothetical protein